MFRLPGFASGAVYRKLEQSLMKSWSSESGDVKPSRF
jgi:hypothetical protein